jgi:cytochrome c556
MNGKHFFVGLMVVAVSASALAASPVSERRASFKQFKQDVKSMHQLTAGSQFDQAKVAQLAKTLNAEAQKPWQYFPAGSQNRDTKPEIWSKPADFKQAVNHFTDATGKLEQVAAAGDLGQIRAQLNLVQKTCKACHDSFRN